MVDPYPSCVASQNLVCKHVRAAAAVFYFDLSFIPEGETIVEVTADSTDPELTIIAAEVLATDLTVDASQGCAGAQLEAGRAVIVTLSGGTPSDDEVLVIINYVRSDGVEDSREGRFIITGTPAP